MRKVSRHFDFMLISIHYAELAREKSVFIDESHAYSPRASAKFIHDHRIGINEISPSPLPPSLLLSTLAPSAQ